MTQESIKVLTKEQLYDKNTLLEIFQEKYESDKELLLIALEARAEELRCKTDISKLIKAFKRDAKEIARSNHQNNITMFGHINGELNCGNWIADNNGIRILTFLGEKIACYHPILPVERLFNIETKTEKITLAYLRDDEWKEITVDKGLIASSTKIVKLADYGVAVTSESSKAMVQFLCDIENMNQIPIKNSTSKFGWHGEEFIPFDRSIVFDDESRFKELTESLKERGSYDIWLDMARKIRKNKKHYEPQLYMAASFASVLLKKLNMLPFIVNLWGSTGKGKAQPLDTKIVTPDGYKLMGDIQIGDLVIGGDGKPHKVIGVYPQGKKDIYEITFKDGRKTRCSKEHLWNVYSHSHGEWKLKTRELQDIMSHPLKTSYGYNFRIPLCKPVEFDSKETLPIPPYLLGALIGDGCLTLKKNPANGTTHVYFNNSEPDIISKVNADLALLGASLRRNPSTTNQHDIVNAGAFIDAIRELNLNTYSRDRFIPGIYKTASVDARKSLLAGLIDTDGNVSETRITYSTLSEQLANDVLSLAHSLGYKASIGFSDRKRTGKREYTVRISTNETIFSSDKHNAKYSDSSKKRTRVENKDILAIVDIQKVGFDECQCLMIDSEEHTYLCDDYIVTHNTVAMMLAASIWANPSENKYITDSYSTQNAFEIRLDILNHLPLMMDDLSKVRDKLNDNFTDLIYLLCSGKGKDRSNVDLGLNKVKTWQCTILSNMERPLAAETMRGGAINRILDFEMQDGYIFESGNAVVEILSDNYGFAGPKFVDYLKDIPYETLQIKRREFEKLIKEEAEKQGSVKEEKQILPLSVLLLADKIATDLIFDDGIYLDIPTMVANLKDVNEVSEGRRAYDTIIDYVKVNINRFSDVNNVGECWGFIEDYYVNINPAVLKNIATRENFSVKAFCSWAKKENLLKSNNDRSQNVIKRNGHATRFYTIRLEPEEKEPETLENTDEDGFQDATQMQLPFD